MPYIEQKNRTHYEEEINQIVMKLVAKCKHSNDSAKGELNYIIFTIIKRFIARTGMSYANAQDFIGGVLTCCQLELYRRILSPHEDRAIERNGDIE